MHGAWWGRILEGKRRNDNPEQIEEKRKRRSK